MHHSRSIVRACAAVLSALVLVAAGGAAQAAPSGADVIDETFSESFTDWCDVPGLTVQVDTHVTGWEIFKAGGKGPLEYFHARLLIEQTNTGPNGVQTRVVNNVIDKDLKVVETESTIEVDAMATGNATMYGPDGKAIARDPGQIRFHLSVDKETGEETFTVTRESTGRSDDFCAVEVPLFTS